MAIKYRIMTSTDGRILAVKVPPESICVVDNSTLLYDFKDEEEEMVGAIELPPGNWRIIGLHSVDNPLSDWEASYLAFSEYSDDHYYLVYEDYCDPSKYTDTAIESMESWCRKHQVYIENPYGETRQFIYDEDAGTDREWLGHKWDEAEKRTGNWLFLLNEEV